MPRAKYDVRRSKRVIATANNKIDKATPDDVARAWEIPDAERAQFEDWLKKIREAHDQPRRYLTRRDKIKGFSKVESAARALEQSLKPRWVVAYMVDRESAAARAHNDVLATSGQQPESIEAIRERVRFDVQAVTRLAKRATESLQHHENRSDDTIEEMAKKGALNLARQFADRLISYHWQKVLKRTDVTFEKTSPFVRAVAAVDKFLGYKAVSVKAIEVRFKKLLATDGKKN